MDSNTFHTLLPFRGPWNLTHKLVIGWNGILQAIITRLEGNVPKLSCPKRSPSLNMKLSENQPFNSTVIHHLGCVYTKQVKSRWVIVNQCRSHCPSLLTVTREYRWSYKQPWTKRRRRSRLRCPTLCIYEINSKISVLLWLRRRRRSRHRRPTLCIHEIDAKDQSLEALDILFPDLINNTDKFYDFFTMASEQFKMLVEFSTPFIRKKNANYLSEDSPWLMIKWVRPSHSLWIA